MPEESSNGYELSSVSATLIQSQRCPQHFGTVLRLTIVIGRSPLQNTSHKEGRADGLPLDERSAKFRSITQFLFSRFRMASRVHRCMRRMGGSTFA
jgi:hypothetical protein